MNTEERLRELSRLSQSLDQSRKSARKLFEDGVNTETIVHGIHQVIPHVKELHRGYSEAFEQENARAKAAKEAEAKAKTDAEAKAKTDAEAKAKADAPNAACRRR